MNKLAPIALSVLSVLFLGLAVYYFVTPANALLHFVPGYDANSSATHVKHAIAAVVLAIGCGVLAWFSMGKKSDSSSAAPEQ